MEGAARRWAELLDGWTIPDEIAFQAPEDPWLIDLRSVAPPFRPEDSPSRRLGREALLPGGTVLDVGCGAGAASLALVPPAGRIVGADRLPEMLAAFAASAQARGVAAETKLGEWPDAAADVDAADVVVCHHVLYNVRDIVAMVVELTGRARVRVVVELAALHPSVALTPLWRHFWRLERPNGPTAGDFLAVLNEAGIEPIVDRTPGRPPLPPTADVVATTRRRLCLPASRDDEVARGLRALPPSPTDVWTFAWPGDA
jgi:SAM-dependent methyltransferase